MIDVLYKSMAIPNSCHLGKRVFKKLFHENAKLGVTDKKAFSEDIDFITWQYTFKPGTIPIQPYVDDQREYLEVALLQVDLKTLNRTHRIAEIVHRSIPYPIVLVYVFEQSIALSLAQKRFSQAEKGAFVAEEILVTEWIENSIQSPSQTSFIESLKIADLPHTHFYAFYSAFVDRVIALDCARLTGVYRLEAAAGRQLTRRNRLAECHEIETQIAERITSIKAETQFNRKVDLNLQVKRLKDRLDLLVRKL
ncbi:MAG: DUF4391 domain-containing protein [bacterium]|nr:DUF4391 domain-containing protein [bacterium]